MRTILIIISGGADDPGLCEDRLTPLAAANPASLNILTKMSVLGTIRPVPYFLNVSQKNALLGILGYDVRRGDVTEMELIQSGVSQISDNEIPSFIIPGFSGHGAMVTTSLLARGIAKMASLSIPDIYSPGAGEEDILSTMADMSVKLSKNNELVVVYTDSPYQASALRDYEAKKEALTLIDRLLINPIADYVWTSSEKMLLAVTADMIFPCATGHPINGAVPFLVYYNDFELPGPTSGFNEITAAKEQATTRLYPSLIRNLCYFGYDNSQRFNSGFDMGPGF